MITDGNKEKQTFVSGWDLALFFLRGTKRYFISAAFFACMVSLFDLCSPQIISYFVDCVIDDKQANLPSFVNDLIVRVGGRAFLRDNLWVIALCILFIALLGALWRYIFRLCNAKGAEKLVKRMRDCLYSHIMRLPLIFHNRNRTGDIIQRCTSDVETVKVFLSDQLTTLFRTVVLIIMAYLFMFAIQPRLALVTLIFLPLIVLSSFFFHRRVGSAFRNADEEEGRLSGVVQENLTGVRVVRAFGKEAYEKNRFAEKNAAYTRMWIRLMLVMNSFFTVQDILSGLQVMTVVLLGSVYCVKGGMSAGQFIAFTSYNAILQWPIRQLGRVVANMSKASVSLERIRFVMNSLEEGDTGAPAEVDMGGDIVFDHVSFGYDEASAKILDDVSFTVKGGTTFGILGGTGSGKTTLAVLLDRLYELKDDGGMITVGGVDIREMNRSFLRRNIGMVLQEPYLFSRSLLENLRIGQRRAKMSEIRRAVRIASLDEAVSRFTRGYDTTVGERGVTLSGGQKQRAAIARMLVRKPPIMIFDDSFSAVDAETDMKIRKALAANTGSGTVIIIGHRISTLMNADHIIVIDNGRIVEEGDHRTLLAKGGIYRKIYELQTEGGDAS